MKQMCKMLRSRGTTEMPHVTMIVIVGIVLTLILFVPVIRAVILIVIRAIGAVVVMALTAVSKYL